MHPPHALWPYLVVVIAAAVMFARKGMATILGADPVATLVTLSFLSVLFLFVAGDLDREGRHVWRYKRDRRLAMLARARVPQFVRESVDGALAVAISVLERGGDPSRVAAVLEARTSRGTLLPMRAMWRYRLAVDRLRDAAGHGDALELELDLGEAERLLWAVRWEVARGSVR